MVTEVRSRHAHVQRSEVLFRETLDPGNPTRSPRLRRWSLALLLVCSLFALLPSASAQVDFRRGDVDEDGVAGTVSDANMLLRALNPIAGIAPPSIPCLSAADTNDDGNWTLADAIFVLLAIEGNEVIPLPGPMTCGPDPTLDDIECISFDCTPTPLPAIPTTTLRLESGFGAVGEVLTVRLFTESTGSNSQAPVGFAASIAHDPSVATIVSVEFSEGLDGFEHSLIEPGRVSLAALNLFGSAVPLETVTITYELIGPGTTALTFEDLPLRTEIAARAGFGGFPLTVDGAIGVRNFQRGDANNDATVDIGDAITILGTLFSGGPESPCVDAADVNDDGAIDLGDPIYTLNFLIGGGMLPPAPGPFTCGPDATPDALRCLSSACP